MPLVAHYEQGPLVGVRARLLEIFADFRGWAAAVCQNEYDLPTMYVWVLKSHPFRFDGLIWKGNAHVVLVPARGANKRPPTRRGKEYKSNGPILLTKAVGKVALWCDALSNFRM